MKYFKLLLLFAGLSLANSRRHVHFYRMDYIYFEEYDTYYKLHWDLNGISWNSAFKACEDEGSRLFYPSSKDEWMVVKNLTVEQSLAPNVTEIYIGIKDEFGSREFVTIDGQITPPAMYGDSDADKRHCVVMNIETGSFKVDSCTTERDSVKPFVCKKVDDKPCLTVDLGYKYDTEAKKCYKVNRRQMVWQEAMHTCYMEGGILAVPENDLEADVIYKMIKLDSNIEKHFIGVRRMFSENYFYTIKGQRLEDSGFLRWYQEPKDDDEDCGVGYTYNNQLYYIVHNCYTPLRFVCEMKARTILTTEV